MNTDEHGLSADSVVTRSDLDRSRTARALADVHKVIAALPPLPERESMLDVGCGFGGLPRLVADELAVRNVHGIDIDEAVLDEARQKGVNAIRLDVGSEALPFDSACFDLLTCFGMLDYLPAFDFALEEFARVLKPGGVLVVSLPNLASWHNRLSLAFGHQLRDIEVSRRYVTGVHPYYQSRDMAPTGHIHTVTIRAFSELVAQFGFRQVRVFGSTPPNEGIPSVLRRFDKLMARRASLAKRFFYIGVRT